MFRTREKLGGCTRIKAELTSFTLEQINIKLVQLHQAQLAKHHTQQNVLSTGGMMMSIYTADVTH